MSESSSMESLDYWRELFSCADADIFQVIKFAILVAWADRPDEFLALRDQITEILYNCWRVQCTAGPTQIDTPDEGRVVDYETPKESKDSGIDEVEPTLINECSNLDEFQALTDEIEEQQQSLGEVLRIKTVLTNWKEESEKALSESLRRLELMEVSVEMLNATSIGRMVGCLRKHKSESIRQLAQSLIKSWKRMVDEWMNAATTTQEASPASFNPSPASEEESLLPSELDFPPLDVGALLATQVAPFEFSKFFDGMDEDGNPTSMKDSRENGCKPRQKDSNLVRKQEAVLRMQKPVDPTHKDLKQKPVARAVKPRDATQKASKLQEILSTPPPLTPPVRAAAGGDTKQREIFFVSPTKLSLRNDVSKESEESSYRHKLEATKRKLQDRYEEAKNAKKQRTIQVMELKDLPKEGHQERQHLKGKNGSSIRRRVNMKSR